MNKKVNIILALEVMSGINYIIGIYPVGTMNVDLTIKHRKERGKNEL